MTHYLIVQLYFAADGTLIKHYLVDGGYEPQSIQKKRRPESKRQTVPSTDKVYWVWVKDQAMTDAEYVALAKRKLTRYLNDRSNGEQS